MEQTDVVVIGAGVVGLACARAFARSGQEVVIVESREDFGTGISARSSEVIHAGLYYPRGTLKARFCVEGNRLLYAYCAGHGVQYQRTGKLVVATNTEQEDDLGRLRRQGEANGVTDLRLLTAREAIALEPQLKCTAALLSPSTGIVDSRGLMLALLGDAEAHGATLALQSPLLAGEISDRGIALRVGGAEPMQLKARLVINAAGLGAQAVAASLAGFPADRVPPSLYAKGNYYSLAGRAPFSRLVYPLPEPGGLGVHLTLDLGGQARFGPDVEWVDAPDYRVDPARANSFYGAIRRYWAGLPDGALTPAYAGIRPKIVGPDQAAADFLIQGPADHGVAGLVNLFGIESPGLTSSLAISDYVLGMTT